MHLKTIKTIKKSLNGSNSYDDGISCSRQDMLAKDQQKSCITVLRGYCSSVVLLNDRQNDISGTVAQHMLMNIKFLSVVLALCRDLESLLLISHFRGVTQKTWWSRFKFIFIFHLKLWKCSDFVFVMYVTLCQCKRGLWAEFENLISHDSSRPHSFQSCFSKKQKEGLTSC